MCISLQNSRSLRAKNVPCFLAVFSTITHTGHHRYIFIPKYEDLKLPIQYLPFSLSHCKLEKKTYPCLLSLVTSTGSETLKILYELSAHLNQIEEVACLLGIKRISCNAWTSFEYKNSTNMRFTFPLKTNKTRLQNDAFNISSV